MTQSPQPPRRPGSISPPPGPYVPSPGGPGYPPAGMPFRPKRPSSPIVFGVLQIVFGGLGVLGALWAIISVGAGLGSAEDPTRQAMDDSALFAAYFWGMNVAGLIAQVLQLVSGIGLVKFNDAARKLAIGLAVYFMILVVVNMTVTQSYTWPYLREAGPRGTEDIMKIVMIATLAITILFTWVYEGLLLYFMTRPAVVDAFKGNSSGGPAQTPGPQYR